MHVQRLAFSALAITWVLAMACQSKEPAQRSPGENLQKNRAVSAASPATADESALKPSARQRGNQAYDKKNFVECVDNYLLSAKTAKSGKIHNDYYNAACCQAALAKIDDAFASLEQAVQLGYQDVGHLEKDSDLVPLHGDPRWKELHQRIADKLAAEEKASNRQLAELFKADQSDRLGQDGKQKSTDWSVVVPRDNKRLAQIKELVASGKLNTATDYFRAAMIFQHGQALSDIESARTYALKAAELAPALPNARWLAAAAEDRLLMRTGKPQRYGTQYTQEDSEWTLYQVDPSVTDEERAEWDCPPLEKAKADAKFLNR